jgi:hypothetical protein
MRASWTRACALRLLEILLFVLCGLTGCQPVHEDRSINWSHDGRGVGFQHGKEGVFVADPENGKLTKIFEPDAGILATSTPLWSPSGRRAIFTTARSPGGEPGATVSAGLANRPEGNLHFQQAILYTCWMYEGTSGGQAGKPTELFTARCDHVGYVAANLAVRWHPREPRIFYIKEIDERHGLFEYDLTSKKSKQVFPHTSHALIFDWTPDGSHLVCVLGNCPREPRLDGTWIGQPGDNDWWHVPHSGLLMRAQLGAMLENLRACRPAWTSDASRFAYSCTEEGSTPDAPPRHSLRVGTLKTRKIVVVEDGKEAYRDMHWRPDGQALGVARGEGDASLFFLRPGEDRGQKINRRPVLRFAGWNTAGDYWAYIAPDFVPPATKDIWALLLLPDPKSRDAVLVGQDRGPESEVLSGMRVTFPQWSSREDKLSLWVTFSPTYRSLPSLMLGWGLRPGDPAAIFDLKTRQLTWMATNPEEKLQVGHYYLLKRDYAMAWHWYEEAERGMPVAKEAARGEIFDYLQQLTEPRRGALFFEYYCLTKLNRPAEAREKLSQFRRSFLSERRDRQSPERKATDQPAERWAAELLDPRRLWAPLLRDLYIAEVLLSLDAAADAEAFLQQSLTAATKDMSRLASALVLAQVLLLEKKHSAYASVATERIGPLLIEAANPSTADENSHSADFKPWIDLIETLSLAPLFDAGFIRGLESDQVKAMTHSWKRLRDQATNESSRLHADLVLQALYQRLGMERERLEAARRIQAAPQAAKEPLGGMDIRELRRELMNLMVTMR